MTTDILRIQPNERIDINDFEYTSNDAIIGQSTQILSEFATDPAKIRNWIIDGFVMSNPSGTNLQVARGRALLGRRLAGAVEYGHYTTLGDDTKTIDLNGYSADTYGIFIKFVFNDGSTESRIFWNPAGDGSEYAQSIATRYLANWSMRIEIGSPGSEWLQIGTVTTPGMAIVDQRNFYFEGSLPDTYESGWSTEGGGIANDRHATRATYGVKDFHTFTAATRQCLEDLKGRGLRRWWDKGIGGMNIGFDTDPTEDVLQVGAANCGIDYNSGSPKFNFHIDNYIKYGSNSLEFWTGGSKRFVLDTNDFYPEFNNQSDLGTVSKIWRDLYIAEVFAENMQAAGSSPRVELYEIDGSSHEKSWAWAADSDILTLRAYNDSRTLYNEVYDIVRSGYVPSFIRYYCALYPETTDTHDLGSTSLRWSDIYANTITAYSTAPDIRWYETDAGADEAAWVLWAAGGELSLIILEDGFTGTPDTVYSVERSAAVVDNFNFHCDTLPKVTDTHLLGSDSYYWTDCFAGTFCAKSTAIPASTSGNFVVYTGSFTSGSGGTAGTIGKVGATTAMNSGWVKLFINGSSDFYFPVWPDA